jgi:hypothetical protein
MRYRLRTLLMAEAALHPRDPLTFLLGLAPLYGLAYFIWRRITYHGYI